MTLISFIVIFSFFHFTFKYPKELNFHGDSWEYQTIAVNLAKGHGYQVGLIEPFETYFSKSSEGTTEVQWSLKGYSFYRTPGYPFFLSCAYRLFGFRAEVAICAQYVLMSFVLACLPWLMGKVLGFGLLGYLSGFLALAQVYQLRYYDLLNVYDIYTETLQSASLLMVLVFYSTMNSMRNQMIFHGILGSLFGICLLVKGAFIFVPLLYALYCSLMSLRVKGKGRRLVFLFFGLCLTLAPWSMYASFHSGKMVFLSTQGKNVLLQGNNDISIKTGSWQPNSKYYDQEKFTNHSNLEKYLYFLNEHRDQVLMMWKRKLTNIFYDIRYPGFLLLYLVLLFRKRCWEQEFFGWPTVAVGLFPVTLALLFDLRFPFTHFWMGCGMLVFILWADRCRYVTLRLPSLDKLSLYFILMVNIFMITIILFGQRRFFAPYNVFLMPMCYLLPLSFFKSVWSVFQSRGQKN